MSHFGVLVVGDNVRHQLAPFHEFECTGIDNEFVVEVNRTEELADDVKEKGLEKALSWHGYSDLVVSHYDEVDRSDKNKYGWVLVKDGVLVECIVRTNPNHKWDCFKVGGRWSDSLIRKDGVECDRLLKSEIDIAAMKKRAESYAAKAWTDVDILTRGEKWESFITIRDRHDDIDAARREYWAQGAIQNLRGSDYSWSADKFLVSLDEYIAEYGGFLNTYSYVDNREWHSRGDMGWWGMSNDKIGRQEWNKHLEEFILSLPDHSVLTIVDCHT